MEGDDARYEAIAGEYDRLRLEAGEAERALAAARSSLAAARTTTVEEEVESAMAVLDDVVRITGDDGARADVNRLLGDLGLRIGLTFGDAVKGKKRIVRRLLSGVMVFGDAPLSVPMHGADNIALSGSSAGLAPVEEAGGLEEDQKPRRDVSAGPGGRRTRRDLRGPGALGIEPGRGSCPHRDGHPGGRSAAREDFVHKGESGREDLNLRPHGPEAKGHSRR